MKETTSRTGSAAKISVDCGCGQQLVVPSDFIGKRFKCPACKQIVVVPPPVALAASRADEDVSGLGRATLTVLWSLLGAAALVAVTFIWWHSHSAHRARIDEANSKLAQAVATAQDWIAKGTPNDGESVERELAGALELEDATNLATGELILVQVRKQRQQLAEQAKIRQAQEVAATILRDAKHQIDSGQIKEGIARLQKYVADENATERPQAERLLAEAQNAVSDEVAFNALIAIGDQAFDQARISSKIDDGLVTLPALVTARGSTIRRNLDKAVQRRIEIKAAAEEKLRAEAIIAETARRESERRAAVELERQNTERLLAEESRRKKEVEDRQSAQNRSITREAEDSPAISSVLGHWRSEKGQHLYIEVERHVIVGADRKHSEPLSHKTTRKVIIPPGFAQESLTAAQKRELGDLLEMLGDVSMQALGKAGTELKDHPGAEFTVIEVVPKQILNQTLAITEVIAVINGKPNEAEWVRLVKLDRTTTPVGSRIQRVDQRKTPD